MLGQSILGQVMVGSAGGTEPPAELSPLAVTQLTVRDNTGRAVDMASVSVFAMNADGTDGSLATIFDDFGSALPNPLSTSSDGKVRFKAEAGLYNVVAVKDSFTARWDTRQVGTSQRRDTGAEPGKIPLFEDLPSGGTPSVGPLQQIIGGTTGDGPATIPITLSETNSPVAVIATGLNWWAMDYMAEPQGGMFWLINYSADTPLPLTFPAHIINGAAGTHLRPMGTLMVVVLPLYFGQAIAFGDIYTPAP